MGVGRPEKFSFALVLSVVKDFSSAVVMLSENCPIEGSALGSAVTMTFALRVSTPSKYRGAVTVMPRELTALNSRVEPLTVPGTMAMPPPSAGLMPLTKAAPIAVLVPK